MTLTEILLKEICTHCGYSYERKPDNSLILIPQEAEQFYMPNLIIKDVLELEEALNEYIKTIKHSSLRFYKIDEEHKIRNYLFYLIKSLTNTDAQDFTSYVKRFTNFLQDNIFADLYYSASLGNLEDFTILARRCEEYYGSETPFTLRFYLDKPGVRYEMPLIRYGISKDIAYIYSIQRKRIYNNQHNRIKEINQMFNKANSGVKENRDITPAMLCSLAIFTGMLKSTGINKIKTDGFLTRRYGYYNGITTIEDRDKVLHNSFDKFNKLFIRLANQFNGIDITSYPLDIDSYMHLFLGYNITSTNELLNSLYQTGQSYTLTKK